MRIRDVRLSLLCLLLCAGCAEETTMQPSSNHYPKVQPEIRVDSNDFELDASGLAIYLEEERQELAYMGAELTYTPKNRRDCYIDGELLDTDALPITRDEWFFLIEERCAVVDTLNEATLSSGRFVPGTSQQLTVKMQQKELGVVTGSFNNAPYGLQFSVNLERPYPDAPKLGSKEVYSDPNNVGEPIFWRKSNVVVHDRFGTLVHDLEGTLELSRFSVDIGAQSFCGDLDFSLRVNVAGTTSDNFPIRVEGELPMQVSVECLPPSSGNVFTCDARETSIGQCVEYHGPDSELDSIRAQCAYNASEGANCSPKTPCCKHTNGNLTSYTYGASNDSDTCSSTGGSAC